MPAITEFKKEEVDMMNDKKDSMSDMIGINGKRPKSETMDDEVLTVKGTNDVTSKPEKTDEPEVKRRKSSKPHKLGSGSSSDSDGSSPNSPASPHSALPPTPAAAKLNERPATPSSGSGSATMKNQGGYNHEFELEMNLSEPLSNMIRLIQPTLNFDLSQASIYLCGVQKLVHTSCLKDCVRDGSRGMVKVKVVACVAPSQKARLNIIDVLQPAPETQPAVTSTKSRAAHPTVRGKAKADRRRYPPVFSKKAKNAAKKGQWIPSESFEMLSKSVGLTQDPMQWSSIDVGHWLAWATKNFDLPELNVRLFSELDGATLCSLSHEMFQQLVGKDNRNLFWTHLEHLRDSQRALIPTDSVGKKAAAVRAIPNGKRTSAANKNLELFTKESSGTIQLWQFLLELLASGNHSDCLEWAGEEGEFRLINPERVAELWGHRKNKANMNYEKMSRALRYYYDGDILGKVPGKHFTYKFICDLKSMVGYSYDELVGNGSNRSPMYSLPPSTPVSTHESATDSEGSVDGQVPRIQKPKPRPSARNRTRGSQGFSQVA